MRITITDKRAKSMARILEAAVQTSGKDRFRYNQALDAVARQLGLDNANALAARLNPEVPDVRRMSAEALGQAARDLAKKARLLAEDYCFARDHDQTPDRADALAAELDRLAETGIALGREARRRGKRTLPDQQARALDFALSGAANALFNMPSPWRHRVSEVRGLDVTGRPRMPLPSRRQAAFDRVAKLLTPHLPEIFQARAEAGRLQLFYCGWGPEQYYVTLTLDGERICFHATRETHTEGMDGATNVEEDRFETLDQHDVLLDAIEDCLEHQEETLFPAKIAGETDAAPEDRLPDDATYARLRDELDRAFRTVLGEIDRVPDTATPDVSEEPAGPVADTGAGGQLWMVYPHRVLREDAAVSVRADSRSEAEREGTNFAGACPEALTWNCYDADYWLEAGYHSERLCTNCGAPTGDPESGICSGTCRHASATPSGPSPKED